MDLMSKGNFVVCALQEMALTMGLLDRLPGYKQMVTSRIALEDLVVHGFDELINRKDDHIKILISPKLTARQQ
jgi:hypothetical protein